MSSFPTPDFGRRAATYDELRPADENWWELYELLIREGDRRGRAASVQRRLVRASRPVARRPSPRGIARVPGASPCARSRRASAGRDLRPELLRRLLAQPPFPVARGDRPRSVPDTRGVGSRARGRRLRDDALRLLEPARDRRSRTRVGEDPRAPHLDLRPP